MEGMIFAAGLGTRLKPLTDVIPKALVEINGKTLLERSIEKMQTSGVKTIVVNVHHFADKIIDFLNDRRFDSKIIISDERESLLNTGGGLNLAKKHFSFKENIVAYNVDIMSDINLIEMEQNLSKNPNSLGILAVRERETSRYLLFDNNDRLCGWENIKTAEKIIKNNVSPLKSYAFSGIQILKPELFSKINLQGAFSMIDLYLSLCGENDFYAYHHDEDKWLDVGKLDVLDLAKTIFV